MWTKIQVVLPFTAATGPSSGVVEDGTVIDSFIWEIAEASSGSVCIFQVYTGKRQDGAIEQNLGYRDVYCLIRHTRGKNHHVFCDNFLQALNLQKICCRTTFTYAGWHEQTGKISQENSQQTMQKWNACSKGSRFFTKETTLSHFEHSKQSSGKWDGEL